MSEDEKTVADIEEEFSPQSEAEVEASELYNNNKSQLSYMECF